MNLMYLIILFLYILKSNFITTKLIIICIIFIAHYNFVLDNWSIKAKRRKTTGTGRMRHLKIVRRRFRYIKKKIFYLCVKNELINYKIFNHFYFRVIFTYTL
jgi:hypothetical protein